MEEGDVINHFCGVWKKTGNPFATFAVLLEIPTRFDNAALSLVSATPECFDINRFVVHSLHFRFVIEGVDVTGTTIHIKEDNRFCFCRKMRFFGR
jgi:hypothetical protein